MFSVSPPPTPQPFGYFQQGLTQQQMQQGLGGTTYRPFPYPQLEPEPPKPKEVGMFNNVKGFLEKNRDIIFTLGLVILVDHFLFKGALRERIKSSIEGVLKKVEDKMHKEE